MGPARLNDRECNVVSAENPQNALRLHAHRSKALPLNLADFTFWQQAFNIPQVESCVASVVTAALAEAAP